jgi:hypothetical protein
MTEHNDYNWDAPFEDAFGKPIVKPAKSGSKARRIRPGAARGTTYAREYGAGDDEGTIVATVQPDEAYDEEHVSDELTTPPGEFYNALDGIEPPKAVVGLAALLDWMEEPFKSPGFEFVLNQDKVRSCKSLLVRNWVYQGGLTCQQIGNLCGLHKKRVSLMSREFHDKFQLPNPHGKNGVER